MNHNEMQLTEKRKHISETPEAIVEQLLTLPPVRLEAIAKGPGIYALYDHESQPRYIGITSKCLNDRIFKRHVGGDGNSHKFSSRYNVGRMFHTRKHPATCDADGKTAKMLRRTFAREYCRAVALPIPHLSKAELWSLEAAVLEIAPPEVTIWNNIKQLEGCEPTELLDDLLVSLHLADGKIAAIKRQGERWNSVL